MKFKSALVTQVSGSIGGMTGSHNRGGLYFRGRSIPVNPNTPAQVAVRGAQAVLSDRWSNVLNGLQRTSYDNYAELVPLPGPLGNLRDVGGVGMYVRSNLARLQADPAGADLPLVDLYLGPLSVAAQPVISIASIDTVAGTADINFDPAEWVDEDEAALLLYASRAQNAGINFFKGPYRLAGTVLGDSTTAPTSPVTITLPFPVGVGQKLFVKGNVTRADGRYSDPFRVELIAT